MPITQVTRYAIVDELHVREISWSGRFIEFLERLYPLSEMPSHDFRYKTAAGDIYQHRVNWDDWADDWVFQDDRFDLYCDDEQFVRFLAETVHPRVRPDTEQVALLVDMYNRHLRVDGWELERAGDISGRSVYGARRRDLIPSPTRQIEETVVPDDFQYLDQQIQRMQRAISADDPDLAIGTAKELIETVCKTLLQELHNEIDRAWGMGRLLKEANGSLNSSLGNNADPESVTIISRGLNTIVGGLAELRNDYGTGHGRIANATSVDTRVARLAVAAASAVASYLFETYDQLRHRDA